jgi:hypothetical protein
MRSFLRTVGLVSGAIAVSSCAGYQPLGTTFIRADGQDLVAEQLAADRAACTEGSDKLENCMLGKGYALVREDEATAKQKEFAEVAEKKKQEQAALAAAEKKKQAALKKRQAALRRAAAKKKKLRTTIAAPAVQPASSAAAATPPGAVPGTANAQASPWPQNTGNPPTQSRPQH